MLLYFRSKKLVSRRYTCSSSPKRPPLSSDFRSHHPAWSRSNHQECRWMINMINMICDKYVAVSKSKNVCLKMYYTILYPQTTFIGTLISLISLCQTHRRGKIEIQVFPKAFCGMLLPLRKIPIIVATTISDPQSLCMPS